MKKVVIAMLFCMLPVAAYADELYICTWGGPNGIPNKPADSFSCTKQVPGPEHGWGPKYYELIAKPGARVQFVPFKDMLVIAISIPDQATKKN